MLRISVGDLLKENTDAIVAIVDPSLSMQRKLCRMIMEQAGRSLMNDMTKT